MSRWGSTGNSSAFVVPHHTPAHTREKKWRSGFIMRVFLALCCVFVLYLFLWQLTLPHEEIVLKPLCHVHDTLVVYPPFSTWRVVNSSDQYSQILVFTNDPLKDMTSINQVAEFRMFYSGISADLVVDASELEDEVVMKKIAKFINVSRSCLHVPHLPPRKNWPPEVCEELATVWRRRVWKDC